MMILESGLLFCSTLYLKLISATTMQRVSEQACWCTNVYDNGFQQPLRCCIVQLIENKFI